MTDYTQRIDELTQAAAAKREAIEAEYPQIGAFFFAKYIEGGYFDDEAQQIFAQAKALYDEAQVAEAEIAAIEAEIEAQRIAEEEAAALAAAEADAPTEEITEPPVQEEQPCEDENIMICPVCGEKFPNNMKFCCYCGAKLEEPKKAEPEPEPVIEAAPQKRICVVCGAELGETSKFCTNCGTPAAPAAPIEPPAPVERRCPQCGSLVNEGDKFCIMCGYRM